MTGSSRLSVVVPRASISGNAIRRTGLDASLPRHRIANHWQSSLREAERLDSLRVDGQHDFRFLLNGQIARLLALENAAGVDADQMRRVRKAVFDRHIPALDVAGFAHALAEYTQTICGKARRCEVETPDHRHCR
jgi:hypothetical protein